MEYLTLFISCFVLFVLGTIWSYYTKPRIPSMDYLVHKTKKGFFINLIGMWIFLIASGLLQRHIVIHPIMLSAANKFISFIICFVILNFHSKRMHRVYHPAPMINPSILNIISLIAQVKALETVEFPIFAFFKCLRVFIVALLLNYSPTAKLISFALSVLCGHFLYVYEFNRIDNNQISFYGTLWLFLFIFSDTYTSVIQENIFKRFKMRPLTMMYYINLFLVMLLIPHIAYHDLWIKTYSISTFLHILVLSITNMIAQFFTLRMIYQFGSIVYVISTTVRTVFFIVLFRLFMNHEIGIFEITELFIITVLICYAMYINKTEWKTQIMRTTNLNPRDRLPIQRQLVNSESNQEEKVGLLQQKSMSI